MVSQAPEVLRSLNSTKQYYFFTPRDEDIASILARRKEDEDKYVPVDTMIHFAEMPEGERDLKIKEYTLVTALKGEVEYIALGEGEGARIVSQPPEETDGEIRIVSGLGRVRNVKGEAIKFERGEIHKTDGYASAMFMRSSKANGKQVLYTSCRDRTNVPNHWGKEVPFCTRRYRIIGHCQSNSKNHDLCAARLCLRRKRRAR